MKIYSIVIAVFLLSGCSYFHTEPPTPTERIIYKTVPLVLPNRPILPTFGAKDVVCISKEIKEKIIERDRLRKQYSEQLEIIIMSTTEQK